MEEEGRRNEPMLVPNKDRFVLFPIQHEELFEMYKKAEACKWTAEEVDLSEDVAQWENKLTDNERHYLKHVLAFFAGSDGIVNENLATRFMTEVQWPEARFFYGEQYAIENVHSHVYSLLIDTYIKDIEEKSRLFNAITRIDSIERKAQWAMKWMGSDRSFGERLVAFAAVEGIFFSGSFCAIFWIRKRGLLPGLTFSNEMISRDEALHCEFACLLFSMLQYRPSVETVTSIIVEAVEIEKQFVTDALPVGLIGMNAGLMCQHIESTADHWLRALGCGAAFNAKTPFEWMELLSLQSKSNFFEKRVGEYAKAGVLHRSKDGSEVGGNRVFSTEEDF